MHWRTCFARRDSTTRIKKKGSCMQRRLWKFTQRALVLAGCLLTSIVFADPLPNAWQINATNSLANYTNDLSADLQTAATNSTGGFDYAINARLLSDSSSDKTIAMAYGLGTNRFLIWFYLDTNGDLIADLDGAATFTLTTNGTGTSLYHDHEILYNPATAQASYLFDGRVIATNWAPSDNSLTNGEILWGAADASGTGTMNFHTVTFKVTNTIVAAYDAGAAPDTAQDPTNFAWGLSPDDSTSVTNVSPDTAPPPAIPTLTTLDATNLAAHQATLPGVGDQGNLAATVWFEWGTDTNYGNITPAQPLLSDTNNFNFSQTVAGLAKGTAYHFRCVATNLQGIAYGQDVAFITPMTMTVTNPDDAGPGTLRQAIADSVPGDTIVIAGAVGTITLTNGELLITNDLTIVSSNATTAIDAGGSSRVLEIAASNTVILDSLTITNGNVPDVGGGILVNDDATLTLTNCTVTGNSADSMGGGIYVTNGTITINNSFLSGNSAGVAGGGIANDGSILVAASSSFSTNFARAGGGILNQNNGLVTINASTISGNFGTNFGGGIINTNGGTATINNSTFSGNACPADQGGGIDNWSMITVNNCTISGSPSGGGFVNLSGIAVCNNSTISGNLALFDGAGFYSFFGTNMLNNCTISGNSAHRRAGGVYENSSLLLLTNTIVAGNTAGTSDPEILGDISGANNLTNGDPLLAPLGNYGGPAQTMPPLAGSPAINAGNDSVTNFLTTDQRGYPRLAGKHVDIGAVEIQPSIVLNTNDDGPGSFRATVAAAPQLITFANTLSGQTIHLTSGQIILSNSVDIDASSLAGGILMDAGGAFRVLEITAGNSVTLDSLTITNGNASDIGGGILVDDDVILALNNCTVAGNVAEAGGGIFISTNSTVAINNCLLSANTATNGGAIESYQAVLTVNNSTFCGNAADNGGAVVSYFGTNTLNNCTLAGNSAGTAGGIFQDPSGVSLLTNTIVAGNTATNAPDIFGPVSGMNDLTNGNPLLASLGNYGGPTLTMPPLAGSPAIDAGLDSVAAFLVTDQRGFPRLSGAHVDIGAVEAQPATVINVNDSGPGSLRTVAAIVPGGLITFTNTLFGQTIHLTSGQITLANGVGIDASSLAGGILIDAGGNSRVLEISVGNSVTLNSLTITNGHASDFGGGILVDNGAALTLTNCNVTGNSAGIAGGGIFNSTNSTVTVNNSTLSDNSANGGGGGIESSGTVLAINNSTFSGNSADNGGAIVNYFSTNTLNNCTLAGNFAGRGGGIFNSNATFTVINSTLTSNSAGIGGGIFQDSTGTSVLTNTIVAGNTATNAPNIFGPVSGMNDLTNGDPLLASLGNYGGPTLTMPPLSGSPAIDAGLDSVAAFLVTDQRGFPRLSGAHVDIGAVEAQSSIVINVNDSGPGSLRAVAAIVPGLITFANTLSGQTIHLTSGQITLSDGAVIDASGLTGGILVDASGNSRVLEISAGNSVTLNSLTITNGHASDFGGGILVDDGATLTLTNCTVTSNSAGTAGGGIFNSTNSTVTVNNSVLSFNSSKSGGAIFNYTGSDSFNNCTFSNNTSTADTGGAVYNIGSLMINSCILEGNNPGGAIAQSSGTLTVNNSAVSYNNALQSGGGFIIGGGRAEFDNSTLSSNSAPINGGGIWNNGAIALNNCTLFGNSAGATNDGGGIYNNSGTNTLVNCTIAGNSAGTAGGIFQDPSGMSLLTNTIVAGNTATNTPDFLGPFSGANNLIGGNPLLAPFGNYGGPTLTMPPMFGSAAIDAGLDSAAPFTTDQRGYPRQSGPHVDIGAVEAQVAPANNRPLLKQLRRQPGGGLSFSFTNSPTADFTVLATTNLALHLNQWTVLGPPAQNPPGQYQFTDSTNRTSRTWFYGVVSP